MEKDEIQTAFATLEHVYISLNNAKMSESNKNHVGHPNRVEHDFTGREKEHLALLRTKVTVEIAKKTNETQLKSSKSSDRLGNKILWLNWVLAGFALMEVALKFAKCHS